MRISGIFFKYYRKARRDMAQRTKPVKTPVKRTNKTGTVKRRAVKKNKYADFITPYITNANKKRLGVGFALIAFLFAILIFRLAYWQIVKASDLRNTAITMQQQDTEIDPVRGTIYDSSMKPLAQTVTKYEMYAYTNTLYKADGMTAADKAKVLKNLATLTGESEDTLKTKLEGKTNLVKLATGLTQSQVNKAKKLWSDSIVVKTKVTRSYTNGDFASHLLGCVNSENSGRTGLEYQYNSILAGVKGRVVRTTDSQGNTLANGSSRFYKAEDGNSIVTSIDEAIQNYVEDALDQGMKDTGAESISCIVMDPKTGDVLAMASTPSYDPNDPEEPSGTTERKKFNAMNDTAKSTYLSEMWTNPVVSGVYEPGSTFKLVTASSALDCGTTTSSSRYTCNGGINVDGTTLHCWISGSHGVENITEAVGNSCNPALARVALDMGKENFYHYLDLYGFMNTTGIDLPGEANSIVQNKKTLTNVDLATMGYGQGIAITPIQLMCAVNAMGNNGVLMKPKIVTKIVNKNGKTVSKVADTAVRQVISKGTADKMRDIMQYYVEKGGGTSAYIPGYRIGGKTGTAYIASGGKYSGQTVASFIAMAPMDDPQVSILVMVTKPSKSMYGAANAGPIVKSILEKTLVYKGVDKKYTSAEEKTQNADTVTVPNVTNVRYSEAVSKLKALGLKYKAVPEGSGDSFSVIDQYPKAGSKITDGGTVYLYSE